MTDLDNPKAWKILLSGQFAVSGETRRAIVITEAGGGNLRLKKAWPVLWTNSTGVDVLLRFQEWTDQDGGAPEAVWPFNSVEGGSSVDPHTGSVRIGANGRFIGRVAGTGRIVVKYTVYALRADGAVDETVIPLDPIIVVER
jgi:hypothetical protein